MWVDKNNVNSHLEEGEAGDMGAGRGRCGSRDPRSRHSDAKGRTYDRSLKSKVTPFQ